MSHYIVCHKKRNNPRMDVRVCEKKCVLREECKELALHRDGKDDALHPKQPESVERRAA
jgi:hypothetical protein